MRILSKFKDYYDYLQGEFGVDEKKVLDRTRFTPTPPYGGWPGMLELVFCSTIYRRYSRKQWEADIAPRLKKKMKWWDFRPLPYGFRDWTLVYDGPDFLWYRTDRALKTDVPYGIAHTDRVDPFPILKELGFDKVLPPKECYLAVEEYISYTEPDVPSDPTDIQRFEGKGFDRKSSFRH